MDELKSYLPVACLLIGFLILASCQQSDPSPGTADDQVVTGQSITTPSYALDLQGIIERDTLKAITTYSSTSYFLYRGTPMGYEYELASRLADHLGVHLEMVVATDLDDFFDLLNTGAGDIVTHNLTVTKDRLNYAEFTLPLNFTHQVLVQRKPDNWRQMKLHHIEKSLVRNPIKLLNSRISVRENSSYAERLTNLQDELGGDITVDYLPGSLTTDQIIRKVSEGEIDFTIADYNIANIQSAYYQNIDIQTTVGVMQRLAWSVRKSSPDLLNAVNEWIKQERKKNDFYVIYNKYFKNTRDFRNRKKSDFYSLKTGQISEYDDLIKQTANNLDIDWRLLASQIYQESQFKPKRKSWAGAVGLMQVMPRTGKAYGYTKLTNPTSNLNAGQAHIEFLNDYWKDHIADSVERFKFILASYNAGHAHVQDARRLAKKHGYDENVWFDNVEQGMLMKAKKQYYTDPVVRYGYCRGQEPVNYVKEILERYEYYLDLLDEEPKQTLAAAS